MFVTAVVFTVLLAAALVVAGAAFRLVRRGPGPDKDGDPDRELDTYEVAFLAEGPARVVNVALVRMHEAGGIHVSSIGWLTCPESETLDDEVQHEIRRYVRAHTGAASVRGMRAAVKRSPAVQRIGHLLARDGLLLRPDFVPGQVLAHANAAVFLLGIPAGIIAFQGFAMPGGPIVVAAAVLGFVVGVAGALERLTRDGRRRLRELRVKHRRSPAGFLPEAVAFGGLAVLESEMLREAMSGKDWYAVTAVTSHTTSCSSDGSSACGSADSGGDSCGGCGGCGG